MLEEDYTQKEGFKLYHKWNDLIFGGSAMVGELDKTLEEVEQELGKPIVVDGERIGVRWLIRFDDGLGATIFTHKKFPGVTFVGGFGKYNKQKENIYVLAVKELFNVA